MRPAIIDIIVVCVLLGFTIYGARRGLFRSLTGLLAVIVALVGASLVAKTLAQPATDLLSPLLEKRIEQRVDTAVSAQGPMAEDTAQLPEQAEALLGLMGMDPETVETLTAQTLDKVKETGVTLAAAVVESLMQSLLYGILFIVAFLALLLAFKLLSRMFDLVLKLPVLHGLNTLGGAAVGLIEAGLLLFLTIWAARRLGISFETELVGATCVLRFFTTNTPLSVLSFLL